VTAATSVAALVARRRRPGTALPRARRLAGAAVAVLALGTAWLTWPRPTVELVVRADGRAFLQAGTLGRLGRRPLPDTVRVPLRRGRATVRITNHDARWQQLGAFGAGAGQSRDYVVSEPAVLSGVCAAHPAAGLTYVIR
jgi:hypothetical protein